MIPGLPDPPIWRRARTAYVALFFLFLLLPLAVVAVFAFNDAPYPLPPWRGFTLDWFIGHAADRLGVLFNPDLHDALGNSVWVAVWVSALVMAVGTVNAVVLERAQFRGKALLATVMLLPLVIPGVILGISILALASQIANWADARFGLELDWLRPGLPLVVAGQFSYIVSIATLTISARLRRFDITLEEAALNLGATRLGVWRTITWPHLRPAVLGSGAVAFLLSFENFNTTLMLAGGDSPLTIWMYGQMRQGATPILNAISLLLMTVTAAVVLLMYWRKPKEAV
ncbi:ABC transporter permease [Amphibiibacter pelophylacis]|uniref:ABC transporter permease n=1 Tax=Amphibiibacter pelophylacis TaxID=1799477 RepID=A0ACC6P5A2_9BURK